jgi:hypothetical protein
LVSPPDGAAQLPDVPTERQIARSAFVAAAGISVISL